MRVKHVVIVAVVGVMLSSAAIVLAGNLEPPGGPTVTRGQMYTLEQIYDRVNDGTAATKMTSFTEPDHGPGSTMHTLEQLYSLVGQRARVAKTGQTSSWAAGDDGALEKGVTWPSPRFVDNGNGTVTDKLTGLMWLQDAFCMLSANWATALTNIGTHLNSGQDFDCYNYTPGTYSDWRMPNRSELLSLMDLSQSGPALPSGHPFIAVVSFDYWTSTTCADDPTEAWQVDLGTGDTVNRGKSYGHLSWPVGGGQ
jgi:hypothetical protein